MSEGDDSKQRGAGWMRSQLIPLAANSLAGKGVAVGPALARYGVAWPLQAVELELSIERHHELLDELSSLSGDPLFAIHVGQARPIGSHGLLEYLWRSSATVEEALSQAVRHAPLLDEHTEFIWKQRPDGAIFGLRVRAHRYGLGRHSNEFFVSMALAEIARLTGAPVATRRVLFEHAQPPAAGAYASELGAEVVEWDAGMTGFSVEPDVLRRPVRTADPQLLATLQHHVGAGQAVRPLAVGPTTAAGNGASALVLKVLREVQGQPLSASGVAKAVQMSERSLQRALAEEGSTLRALTERVRMEVAERRLLHEEVSLDRLAADLGYASTSTFARAFGKWRGQPPGAFRSRKPPG